jgi:hypothetical protein
VPSHFSPCWGAGKIRRTARRPSLPNPKPQTPNSNHRTVNVLTLTLLNALGGGLSLKTQLRRLECVTLAHRCFRSVKAIKN